MAERSFRDRRRARAWSLQILYAWEARGGEGSPLDMYEEFVAERNISSASRGYIVTLLRTIGEHRAEIDAAVEGALTNWRLGRLAAIDRNVLRIAAAEMLYLPDVPPRASIQEAISLAEKFGTADSPRFVNGVLDALMRRIERHRRPRPPEA